MDVSEFAFIGERTGRAILEEKAQSLVNQYNEMLEEESIKFEELKEKILSEANKLVERLAAEMATKQQQINDRYTHGRYMYCSWLDLESDPLCRMQDKLYWVQQRLQQIEAAEEELQQFSAGLNMICGEMTKQ